MGGRRGRGVVVFALLAWGVPAAAWFGAAWAQDIGLDYWQTEHDQTPFHEAKADALPLDAIKIGGDIWVFYKASGQIEVATYNLTTGLLGTASGELLAPDTDSLSLDQDGISSANVELCRALQRGWTDLNYDSVTGLYEPSAQDIGIAPPTIEVRDKSGPCASINAPASSFVDGYQDDTVTHYDQFALTGISSCSGNYETKYRYTNCSLTGSDRFWCEPPDTVDTDSYVERGYCKLMMMYEGLYDDGTNENHYLILARSQEPDATWRKAISGSYPVLADVRVRNTGPHHGGSGGVYSFAGVPDLAWDDDDDVWRMWFVSEDEGSIRYSQSSDDGINWGITSTGTSIDCYDTTASAFDTTKCVAQAWVSSATPPEDTDTTKNAFTIDPGVVLLDLDTDPDLETLGMFFAGADDGCDGDTTDDIGEKRIILVGTHDAMGDQGGSTEWTWDNTVHADSVTGVLIEQNSTDCESDDTDTDPENYHEQVYDPSPLRVSSDKYVMFFGMRPDNETVGNLYVAASGFECSDFVNNDADTLGLVDYGNQTGQESYIDCESPSDDSE